MKTNIKHVWTVICNKSIIDGESNVMSLLEVIDRIEVKLDTSLLSKLRKGADFEGVVLPVQFEVVSFWEKLTKKNAEGHASLVILSPKKEQLGEFPMEIKIPTNTNGMRMRAKMNQFKINSEGRYTVEVHHKIGVKSTKVAEIPLEVIIHELKEV